MIIRLGKFTYSIWTSINELPSSSLCSSRYSQKMKEKQRRQFPYGSAILMIALHFFDFKDAVQNYSNVWKKERTTKNQHWNHDLKVLTTNAKQKDTDIVTNGKHKQRKDVLTVLWFYGFTVLSFAGVLVYRFAGMVDMQVNNK